MAVLQRISPCLWFDTQAEDAARFYCDIFPNSSIVHISHYTDAGFEHHGRQAGEVLTVDFILDGQQYTALNGGPVFQFNPAISLQVFCESQEEVDHYWDKLGEGGDPRAQQCGWLADRFGVSWQVVPVALIDIMKHPDRARVDRAFNVMLGMKKLEIAPLLEAFGK